MLLTCHIKKKGITIFFQWFGFWGLVGLFVCGVVGFFVLVYWFLFDFFFFCFHQGKKIVMRLGTPLPPLIHLHPGIPATCRKVAFYSACSSTRVSLTQYLQTKANKCRKKTHINHVIKSSHSEIPS